MQDNIKLATRESPLALRQANIVKEYLLDNNVFNKIDIVAMSTSGDRADNETFKRNGGKGLFLKELENALIEGKAHIAVHSMKDVPARVNDGFLISSIMEREDPCDVFISNSYKSIEEISAEYLFTHVRGEIPPHVVPEVDLERFDKFKTVFAGDLHAHSNTQRNIVYPGSPMTTSFHRQEVETGYLLINPKDWSWNWWPFTLPQLIR